mmetsp:Transcript_10861/g.25231  ORF Transcript_10861/g.25231 Transcript_10861/m.25231 type:complete len:246 (-) Transcript_10861:307-1044(-)
MSSARRHIYCCRTFYCRTLQATGVSRDCGNGSIDAGKADIIAALACSSVSCSFLLAGGSRGGCTIKRTPRGLASGKSEPGGWKTWVPMIEMGTTLTFARAAMVKGPFLKAMILPSLERVPSGKVTSELPPCRHATASLNVASCDARSVRLIAMCLANCIAHPIRGIRKISTLETYLNRRGRHPEREKMSRKEQWLGTYNTASSGGGRFSLPSTLTLEPIRARVHRAQSWTTQSHARRRTWSNLSE